VAHQRPEGLDHQRAERAEDPALTRTSPRDEERPLDGLTLFFYDLIPRKFGSKEARKIADCHAGIVDAVAARDGSAAAETARNHIWDALRFFERRHSGLLDEPLQATMLLGRSTMPERRRTNG
jgi:hypothetical protein